MKEDRLLLIDLLKILILLTISILHTNEFIFSTDLFPIKDLSYVWWPMSFYARCFSIGGQILICLVYFLFAYTEKSRKSLSQIMLFALLGQLTLGLIFDQFEWDIYAYIAATNLLLVLVPALSKKSYWILGASFFYLCIPSSYLQNRTPDTYFWCALTGKVCEGNTGAWPLFPWIFLAIYSYQMGAFAKAFKTKLTSMTSLEKYFLWPLLLLGSIPFLGAYFWTPIGVNYYAFVFNQPPYIFWANFIPFLFIIRLSFLKSIQDRIQDITILEKISKLYWIRHLGITYLISLIYLGIASNYDHFGKYPFAFDILFIGIMPVSEGISRLIVGLKQRVTRYF